VEVPVAEKKSNIISVAIKFGDYGVITTIIICDLVVGGANSLDFLNKKPALQDWL